MGSGRRRFNTPVRPGDAWKIFLMFPLMLAGVTALLAPLFALTYLITGKL